MSRASLSYAERSRFHDNPAAKRLLEVMERKKSNLCVSVDVTTSKDLLEVVRRVGASCCMVKVSGCSNLQWLPSDLLPRPTSTSSPTSLPI